MARVFNVTGSCNPQQHYMVDIEENLKQIKNLIDAGAYFTINRARQYGKTTTLKALKKYIKDEYVVVSVDFQFLSRACFRSEGTVCHSFYRAL